MFTVVLVGFIQQQTLFTARVRSTREGNVLTLVCVSVHTCRGTPPQDLRSGWGGYPIPGLDTPPDMGWGTPPRPGMEYPLHQTWDGVPPLDLEWVPSPRPGMGYPPRPGTGYPPRHGMGYPPETDQHSEHLLRSGRYASCIHTGGLSCSKKTWGTDSLNFSKIY